MNDMKAVKNLLYRIGAEAVNEAKELAPVGKGDGESYRGGNLKKDIQVFDDNIDNLEVSIGNSKLAPYAKFVHGGTKPHKIQAKNKRALRTPFGARKSVNHPGTKAQPYLEDGLKKYMSSGGLDRALNDTAVEIRDEFIDGLKKSLKNATVK